MRCLLLSLLLVAVPSLAAGQACPPAVEAWARECTVEAESVHPRACPPGHVIFDVGSGHLGVDVSAAPGFASFGVLSASPIGNFPDWSAAPAEDRAAFDALGACLQRAPSLAEALASEATPAHEAVGRERASDPSPASPGPMLLSLLLLAEMARRLGSKRVMRGLAVPLALGLGAFVLRRVLMADGYFHQNGQGPLWVGYALGQPSDYGPGYREVFGLASLFSDPDAAVFLIQGLLSGALVAALALLGERIAGRVVGLGVGLAAATSPLLARLSGSESYFGAQASLLALAAAILVVSTERAVLARLAAAGGPRWVPRALGPLAAGALIAQVARVHPIAWLACALVPSVLLVLPGSARARWGRAVGAGLICSAMVVGLTGPAMLDVLAGSLGQTWMAPAQHRVDGLSIAGVAILAFFVVGSTLSPKTQRFTPLVSMIAVLLLMLRSDLLAVSMPYAHHAYAALFLGPIAACIAVSIRVADRRAQLGLSAAILVAALAWHVTTRETETYRATDALEGDLFRRWRDTLPEGAVLAHLEVADRHVLTLPWRRTSARLRTTEPLPALDHLGPEVFYYRSGLCSTRAGRSTCEDIEARYRLRPLRTATLPARPSLTDLAYDAPSIEVGLYRVSAGP